MGRAAVAGNPEGALRVVAFGQGRGSVVYLVLEEQRIVDVLRIVWP